MWNRTFFAAAMAGALIAGAQPAAAFGPGGFVRDFATVAVVNYTSSIKPIFPTSGCKAADRSCGASVVPFKMALTTFRQGQMKRINAAYNRSLNSMTGRQIALAKLDKLVAMGFPPEALQMEGPGANEGALLVRTDRGDFLLGNRDSMIIDIDRMTTAAIAR